LKSGWRRQQINLSLTIDYYAKINISAMSQENLRIEQQPGTHAGQAILRLEGPLVLTTVFSFQSTVRADSSRSLIIDFSKVPYADSAGIGALVGAYVTRQNGGRSLALVGVSERVRHALQVTRVEQFFRFFDSVDAAGAASGG
jgi:anti-sigma B factor antagonist